MSSHSMVSFDIAQGNPGALTFIMEAYWRHLGKAEQAFRRMRDNDILGTRLYMLWNDCCGRNTDRAIDIMLTQKIDKIVKHINYEGGRGIPFQEEDHNNEKTEIYKTGH